MKHSMLTRLFSIVMAILLVVLSAVTLLAGTAMRDRQINGRLDRLTDAAEDIAYLAGQTDSLSLFSGADTLRYLSHKAAAVQKEYDAYILVLDAAGRTLSNLRTAYEEDPDFIDSLSGTELSAALNRVLGGEQVRLRSVIGGELSFTVGVPFIQNGVVRGAVLVRTNVQTVTGDAETLMRQVVLIALAALVLAAVLLYGFVRAVLHPLNDMTEAAGRMAAGDFSVRVPQQSSMTELAALAHAFNTMGDQLEETETSRKEFVANVSHELRSPITSIRGFVEGMEDGTIPPEEHPKYLHIVSEETRRLSKLIGDLLALSRLEREDAALTETDFDICEMLRRVALRRVNDLDAKQMDVDFDLRDDSLTVHADSDRIEQVLVNLVDNAIKFTPAHGRLRLTAYAEGGSAVIRVSDNGIGILPEDRPHIFERFFTADRAHTAGNGTGLGLSICQRILAMHGSRLELDDVAEGTSFTFRLNLGVRHESA